MSNTIYTINTILAIDTSADDTSAAVTDRQVVLSNCIWSQVELHKEWGGIVPSIAKRAHAEYLPKAIKAALSQAGKDWSQIDGIAVTVGPGLSIALEIGVAKAKRLAIKHQKPLILVNHMEGHLFSSFAVSRERAIKHGPPQPTYPLIAILASGGHTEVIEMSNATTFIKRAETLDDAIGEAFDKVGRMLGLGYPAGSTISRLAEQGDPSRFSFTEPLLKDNQLAFSYSGLKTAVLREVRSIGEHALTKQDIADLSASFQQVAVQHILRKTTQILKKTTPAQLALGGGVAANLVLRKRVRALANQLGVPLLLPFSKKLCQDNAAMIGVAGWLILQSGKESRVRRSKQEIESVDRDPVLSIEQEPGFSE